MPNRNHILTFDEKKSAEAAFGVSLSDPAWSPSAQAIYAGDPQAHIRPEYYQRSHAGNARVMVGRRAQNPGRILRLTGISRCNPVQRKCPIPFPFPSGSRITPLGASGRSEKNRSVPFSTPRTLRSQLLLCRVFELLAADGRLVHQSALGDGENRHALLVTTAVLALPCPPLAPVLVPVPPVCAEAPAVIATAVACAPNSKLPLVKSSNARLSSKKMIWL